MLCKTLHTKSKSLFAIFAAICLAALSSAPVENALAASSLRGYSVLMTWTEVAHVHRERNPKRGNEFDTILGGSAKVYVSDRGRIFGETQVLNSGSGGRHARAKMTSILESPDEDSDQSASDDNQTWHWTISGDIISGTKLFLEGARRVNARVFREGDQLRCELQVILGKFEGRLVRTGGRRNAPEEVLSSEVRDPSCQVVSGNVFAQ